MIFSLEFPKIFWHSGTLHRQASCKLLYYGQMAQMMSRAKVVANFAIGFS